LFCAECTKKGFTVSMPILDSSIYDCLVDTGDKIFKVQIKSSQKTPINNENTVNIYIDNPKREYTKDKVHYFAVYSSFYEGFFVFPNLGNMKAFRASKSGKNNVWFNNFNFV